MDSNLSFLDNEKSEEGVWIFGYGSLVWKADFPFEFKMTGFIKGFLRRFYQNSIDHRGTKKNPGRVCTLISSMDPESKVWGIAYKISENDKLRVLEHLDFREQNGYSRREVKFYPYSFDNKSNSDSVNILLYVATNENESFAGESNLEDIANQMFHAIGKSGTNREYVYKLANSMRSLYPGQNDDHLFGIEKRLLEKEKTEIPKVSKKSKGI